MHVAYLFACCLGGLIWVTLYRLRIDLQPLMVRMSTIGLPLALSDIFYVPQYWRPETLGNVPVGIEGFLFSFEAAGICTVIYPAVFQMHLRPDPSVETFPLRKLAARPILIAVLPLPVSALVSGVLHTNLEWGLYAGLLASTALTATVRPDLLKPQLLAAATFLPLYAAALVTWIAVFPTVHEWFTLWRMPHWYLLGAPLEEIVFGCLFAAYWTGLYPMLFERRFIDHDRALRQDSTHSRAGGRLAEEVREAGS